MLLKNYVFSEQKTQKHERHFFLGFEAILSFCEKKTMFFYYKRGKETTKIDIKNFCEEICHFEVNKM